MGGLRSWLADTIAQDDLDASKRWASNKTSGSRSLRIKIKAQQRMRITAIGS